MLLGLAGLEPDTVDVEQVPTLLAQWRAEARLPLLGLHPLRFVEADDLLFLRRESLPFHANGMRLAAHDADGHLLLERSYYSVGGGFVVSDELAADGSQHKRIAPDTTVLPLPFTSGDQLLQVCRREGLSIAQVMRRNEQHWRTDDEIAQGLLGIWRVMQDCVSRGCRAEGTLPGGFKVKRLSLIHI